MNNQETGLEIAVIGMAGRFPGAKNIDEFWNNLKNGIESISYFSDEELEKSGIDSQLIGNPDYVKAKGIIGDVEYFDAPFFDYSPREVEVMDPQTRIFNECTWEVLENAGYDPHTYPGLIGLYAGANPHLYWQAAYSSPLLGLSKPSEQFTFFHLYEKDFMATRISYKLNLKGPSFTVFTACSTSLVAIHLACISILSGECSMALAGGISIWLPQKVGYLYEERMILSVDGHNRSFDKKATGSVFGDGVGIVLLKRLEDALADGDTIHAVIKGSAINNDGNRKLGYTAPSVEGQAEVIRSAQQVAEVEPESISYLETHGTATELGDAVEIEALNRVFKNVNNKKKFCAIGTVKTNVGHLNCAAGVTGFIKTVLSLKYRMIPTSLYFEIPNPKIDFENSPFYINRELSQWKHNGAPLRAGVSSFGIGGTNAHVILEEAPPVRPQGTEGGRGYQLILLSARTESALDKIRGNFVNHLKQNPGINLEDAAYTLQVGRKTFKHRCMLVSSCVEGAVDALSSPGNTSAVDPGKVYTAITDEKKKTVIFMFSGVGSQYVNMGRDLYEKEPIFREEMDRCFEISRPLLDYDIKEIFYPDGATRTSRQKENINKEYKIHYSDFAQLIIFIFEYALAKLLMKWGIKPDALIGYSFGEYVAACIAGVFSLEDGLKLVVSRANLIRQTPEGAMLSVPVPVDELKPLVDDDDSVSIAIDNGSSTIVAGTVCAIDAFEKKMKHYKYLCMRVDNSRALHSKEMEPILKAFEEQLEKITLKEPQIPFISNVTGKRITGENPAQPCYWVRHLRETVRFADLIKGLLKEPNAIFVEIGPGRDLSVLMERHLDSDSNQKVVSLVRPPQKKVSDVYYLSTKLGWLWLYGITLHWEGLHTGENRLRIPLPTYPFEGEPYRAAGISPGADANALPGISQRDKIKDFKDWFYLPSWKRSRLSNRKMKESPSRHYWLLFIDQNGVGTRLAQQLTKRGKEVITATPGETFSKIDSRTYVVNPYTYGDYEALFKDLHQGDKIPGVILHLWNITDNHHSHSQPIRCRVDRAVDLGFHSLVFLAKAIGNQQIFRDIQMDFVTNNMQEVTGKDGLCPEKAVVLGPCKIIPREYPNIRCRSIDIVLQGPGNIDEYGQGGAIIELLLDEFDSASPDAVIAYRDNYRWVQVFDPYPLDNPQEVSLRLKEKGVYLITGGLGGIGLILAEYLAKKVNAKLVLTGRSAFPPRDEWKQRLENGEENNGIDGKIRKLLKMEKLGSEVLVLSADVTDRKQMQEVFARTEAQFGRINGVIHSAGLPDGKVIRLRTREDSERILAAKISGTLVLDSILEDKKPDFFMLCSSIGAIVGAIGQVSYCSANAFLDAYALYKSSTGDMFAGSINWDRWKHVGFAAIVESQHKDLTGKELAGGITAQEGVEAFRCILGETVPQIIVSPYDVNVLIEQLNTSTNDDSSLLETIEENIRSRTRRRRPELETEYIAPRNETEYIIAEIYALFFGLEKIGVQDDFFELGGDSLKAIAISTQISKKLNTNVPISVFFDKITIEGIAEYIDHTRKSTPTTPSPLVEPVKKKEYYSTTVRQEKFFFLNEMEGIDTSLNIFRIVVIEGKLNKHRFEESFHALIKRQESFRTSFHIKDDKVMMKIHETNDVNLPIEYIELQENENHETKLDNIIKNFSTPFDLNQPPLIKVKLVRLEEEKHMMLFDAHHIILDDGSMRVLLKEFIALCSGEELPGLKLQYKDYAEWQHKFLESEAGKKMESYWMERFKGEVSLLDMPTDYPRPKTRRFEGQWIRFSLEDQLLRKLKRLGEDTSSTLHMILLAALNILLSRYTGQEDITITSPIIGKEQEELENIIGLFINLLPLRNFVEPGKTFLDFLSEVKHNALTAYENQAYPFGKLVEKLGLQKDLSRNPLNDVELIMVNTDISKLELDGLRFIPYEYNQEKSMVDISLEVTEWEESVSFNLMYCTELFKRETMDRFINSFKEILVTVTENKDILLGDITISADLGEAKPIIFDDKGDFDF